MVVFILSLLGLANILLLLLFITIRKVDNQIRNIEERVKRLENNARINNTKVFWP